MRRSTGRHFTLMGAEGKGDLADEVLAVICPEKRGRLIAERDRLKEIAGKERRGPGGGPVFLVVWSMLSGSHCSLPFTGLEPYEQAMTALVDRAGARHRDDILILAQRREAAEHLLPHCLHVLSTETPHPTWEPHRAQKPALLPTADRVLVDLQCSGGLSDLHQLRHAVRIGERGENVNVSEMVDFGERSTPIRAPPSFDLGAQAASDGALGAS
jgi:hypothetical protein